MTRPRPIRTAAEHTIEVPRTARYYVLGAGSAPGRELWLVLHGFGQLAGDFIEYFSALDDGKHLVAAPEALNRYYTQPVSVPSTDRHVGATWMTKEFRDHEIRDYVRYLDIVHAALVAAHRPRRTVLVGFSQGGATATRWAMQGDTAFHSVILWGATLPPDVELSAVNRRLRGASLRLVIGRTDQYIPPEAVAAERARLDAAGVTYDLTEYDAGHSIKRAVLTSLAERIAAEA
ncbi:MAG TPA: alpha/beta fold hydrolase [Gemmatimonadaceae bacterium]|nr:alpha/beta fold hydrolase [Gemmatimonadaceae bacterium]